MLYRVRIDLCFDKENIGKAVIDKAKTVLSKAKKLAVGGDEGESSYIEIHKCYHDEANPKPCEMMERIEI